MRKCNLCELCVREYSECMNDHENLPNIVYGDCGDGIQDSVLECDWFMGKHEPVDQYQGDPNIS